MREDLKPGDFGYRRKRNIDLGDNGENGLEIASGINWTRNRPTRETVYQDDAIEKPADEYADSELEEGYEEVEIASEEGATKPLMLGAKPIKIDKLKAKKQQDMEKVTIYLDMNLMRILKMLKKDNKISYSRLIQDALEYYLTT